MTQPSSNPVGIRLEGVSVRFQHGVTGEVQAVKEVSLTVQPGELLTLLGPSGCGKTTTLRMIAGFQQPSEGKIWFGDTDVTSILANDRNIGFVFQNYALFPHLSVFENVAYGLRIRKIDRSEITERVEQVLGVVGLARYGRQLPHQLSGGEQQRVALARAIVIRPRVLLFDEPLSNLDAKLRVQMRLEIQRLQKRLGITAVYVTHDQEEAMAISDRIAVMNRGEIAQDGTAETLYRRPANAFVAQFIGRSNLVPAQVAGTSADTVTLSIDGHLLVARNPPHTPKIGATVRIVVRPEAITLSPADGPALLHGEVITKLYLGDKIDYHVQVGDTLVEVVTHDASTGSGPAQGDRVGLHWSGDGLTILEEDA